MLETVFEQCALSSGLVQESQLESAWREMKSGKLPDPDEIPKALSEILVRRGVLNRWQASQLLAGRTRFTLGSYRIFDSIGQGGMGQVFKARHEVIDRVVAIKVLPLDKSTPQAVQNFQNEIQASAMMNHSNLVQAIDAGMDGNVYYLVTEYVPGPDLRKLVRNRGILAQESAASIIVQVARALQHAHRAGVVHRDVKPGNILVTMRGIAKLSDLGLASSSLTPGSERPNRVVGTADYISPDQVRNPAEPRPVWDIYSLGCTLYYIVTGKVPYPGGTTAEKVKAHLDQQLQPLDPCRLNPMLTRDFVDCIGDMMAKNAHERIASVDEVMRRLGPWSDGSPRPVEVMSGGVRRPVVWTPAEGFSDALPTPAPEYRVEPPPRPELAIPPAVRVRRSPDEDAELSSAIPRTLTDHDFFLDEDVEGAIRGSNGGGEGAISPLLVFEEPKVRPENGRLPPPPPPGKSVTKWTSEPEDGTEPEDAQRGQAGAKTLLAKFTSRLKIWGRDRAGE